MTALPRGDVDGGLVGVVAALMAHDAEHVVVLVEERALEVHGAGRPLREGEADLGIRGLDVGVGGQGLLRMRVEGGLRMRVEGGWFRVYSVVCRAGDSSSRNWMICLGFMGKQ